MTEFERNRRAGDSQRKQQRPDSSQHRSRQYSARCRRGLMSAISRGAGGDIMSA
jgi:hypothetical protein